MGKIKEIPGMYNEFDEKFCLPNYIKDVVLSVSQTIPEIS